MDRFRTMQSFARVVRAGSFTLAAHQLGLSRALVSRHVRDLETRLGVRLLNRSTRSLHLTEEGRQYLDFCEQLFRDLETQEDAIAQVRTEPAGALRILAPTSFGALHIADAVIAFAKTQPRLRVSLLLENTWFRQNDFSQRELDIALRFAPIRKTQMVAEPIADFDWVVCAAPEYLERRGRPARPGDLASHACLIHANALPDDHIWRFVGPKGSLSVRVNGAMYSNSALALCKMALASHGIAFLPSYCVAADLSRGTLEPLLPRYKVPRRTLHAVYPRVDVVPKKIPLFTEFLAKWMVARSIGHPAQ